jgi:hypothetical protein
MVLVRGLEAPARYKVAARCSNPDCKHFSDHAHHIFRRSALSGDYAWVSIGGYVIGNLTGLCFQCHEDVTGAIGGHKAGIRWHEETKTFMWCWVDTADGDLDYIQVAPLNPQPPTPDTLAERTSGQENEESEHCPFCGHTKRRRESAPKREKARRRKNWSVSVPDDTEDGAEILDSFTDDAALLLGAGDWTERNKRYWTIVHVFAWVMQHREDFAKDVRKAAA